MHDWTNDEAGLEADAQLPPELDSAKLRSAVGRAFDALLDQVAPSAPDLRLARQLCGRWLTMQRQQVDLTVEMVAERCGIAPEVLQLVEAGLALNDPAWVPAEYWYRLCLVLEAAPVDYRQVREVLHIANGQSENADEVVLAQVEARLDQAMERRVEQQEELLTREEIDVFLSREAPTPLNFVMFYILMSLINGATPANKGLIDGSTIQREVRKRARDIDPIITQNALVALSKKAWILEPAYDTYSITDAGRSEAGKAHMYRSEAMAKLAQKQTKLNRLAWPLDPAKA